LRLKRTTSSTTNSTTPQRQRGNSTHQPQDWPARWLLTVFSVLLQDEYVTSAAVGLSTLSSHPTASQHFTTSPLSRYNIKKYTNNLVAKGTSSFGKRHACFPYPLDSDRI
jgi:hypothetical protein